MNEQPASCPRESETVAATRSGVWSMDLQAHVQTCEHCRSTQLMTSSLGRLATDTHRLPHRLPDYRVLWLRAKFQQRQQLARRFDALLHGIELGTTRLLLFGRKRGQALEQFGHAPGFAEKARLGVLQVARRPRAGDPDEDAAAVGGDERVARRQIP